MNKLITTILMFTLAVCLVAQMPRCSAQTPGDAFVCGRSIVSDVDGNIYNTVQIGSQCWMRENLRTTRYSDCTPVAGRYAPDDEANVPAYGYLYNWAAVMNGAPSSSANPSGVQGVCPDGWHVPSDAEWTQLTDHVSSQSRYLCGGSSSNIAKALASETGWSSSSTACAPGNNPSGNNAAGFSALPAGFYDGDCTNFGFDAYFWSSTEDDIFDAYFRNLYYRYAYVDRYAYSKDYGQSVRCLRN